MSEVGVEHVFVNIAHRHTLNKGLGKENEIDNFFCKDSRLTQSKNLSKISKSKKA